MTTPINQAELTKFGSEPPTPLGFKMWLLANIAYGISLLFTLTYRIRFLTSCPPRDEPHCLALRHENLFAALICLRQRGYVPLASLSKDGSLITYVLEKLGYPTIRGSSSRGGEEARDLLTQVVDAGYHPAITIDGPRGPRRRVKGGVVDVARRTGIPVISLVALADRNWVFRSWDRFKLPKPFATIYLAFSDPLRVDPDTKGLKFGEVKSNIAQSLNQLEKKVIAAGACNGEQDQAPAKERG